VIVVLRSYFVETRGDCSLKCSSSKDRDGIFVNPGDSAVIGIWRGLKLKAMFGKQNQAAAMPTFEPSELPLIERVERALVLLAYFIELDGDVHVSLFEKFEAELGELRQAQGAKDRARRLLAHYSREGGLNAIDSKCLSLSSSGGPLPYLTFPVR